MGFQEMLGVFYGVGFQGFFVFYEILWGFA